MRKQRREERVGFASNKTSASNLTTIIIIIKKKKKKPPLRERERERESRRGEMESGSWRETAC